MAQRRTILEARAWSATVARTSAVLVVLGLVVVVFGALASIPGLIYTGGAALAVGVVIGVIGVIASWFQR